MKKLILLLILLISSFSSFARTENGLAWLCIPYDREDADSLERLNIRPEFYFSEIKALVIPQENYCNQSTYLNVTDYCKFEGHRLYVSPYLSYLQSKNGPLIKLRCEESEILNQQGGVGGSN